MDNTRKEMKAQVGYLTSCTYGNQEEMEANLDACLNET